MRSHCTYTPPLPRWSWTLQLFPHFCAVSHHQQPFSTRQKLSKHNVQCITILNRSLLPVPLSSYVFYRLVHLNSFQFCRILESSGCGIVSLLSLSISSSLTCTLIAFWKSFREIIQLLLCLSFPILSSIAQLCHHGILPNDIGLTCRTSAMNIRQGKSEQTTTSTMTMTSAIITKTRKKKFKW